MIFSQLRNKRRTAVETVQATVGCESRPRGAELVCQRLRAACIGGIRTRRPVLQLISYNRINNCTGFVTKSADLNPIENVWAELVRRMYRNSLLIYNSYIIGSSQNWTACIRFTLGTLFCQLGSDVGQLFVQTGDILNIEDFVTWFSLYLRKHKALYCHVDITK